MKKGYYILQYIKNIIELKLNYELLYDKKIYYKCMLQVKLFICDKNYMNIHYTNGTNS